MANINESIPSRLSFLDNLGKMPPEVLETTTGIYFLCQKKRVVYVGKSISIQQRIQSHINELTKAFDEVYFIKCRRADLDATECALIRLLRPVYNLTFGFVRPDGDEAVISRISKKIVGASQSHPPCDLQGEKSHSYNPDGVTNVLFISR
jgi:hypothetical protein